jgi:hypothetical protein
MLSESRFTHAEPHAVLGAGHLQMLPASAPGRQLCPFGQLAGHDSVPPQPSDHVPHAPAGQAVSGMHATH